MNDVLDQEAAPGPAAHGVLQEIADAVPRPPWLERGDVVAATARACIAVSIAVHAVVMLWLVLGPGGKPFDPANAEPILVELLPAQEAQSPKTESKSDDSKSDSAEAKLQKDLPIKPAPAQAAAPRDQKLQPKSNPQMTAQELQEERAATAARLAWMLNLPTETAASLAAPPAESKSNLSPEEIAAFKAQVGKCFAAPKDTPDMPEFEVVVRIALRPDGKLGIAPELIQAPNADAGPPLVDAAKRALQRCQPYTSLPPDRYRDWKIMDVGFSARGPAGLSGPPPS
jgi:hypothetical protein